MKPLILGHRGASSLAPENSLQGIEKAHEIGVDGVEVDVQLSADDELVLFHDRDLVRTTNVAQIFPDRLRQPLCQFTLAELQHLEAGSWFVEGDPFGQIRAGNITMHEQQAMAGTLIPRLIEVLDFIREKNWFINIELKSFDDMRQPSKLVEALIALIDRVGLPVDSVAISSFDHRLLYEVQSRRADLVVNALIGSNRLLGNRWGSFEFKVYNANAAHIDEAQLSNAQAHGCRVNLYTVNDLEQARTFARLGVAGLITDYPQYLVSLKT